MEPFIGEIILFGGTFAPRGYALCDGQLLQINGNEALFSLLGTIYGGDGRTTFGLPDLRGRAPVHEGQGAGLTNRRLGQKAGGETVTLNATQLPAHTHPLKASTDAATGNAASGQVLANANVALYGTGTPGASIATAAIAGDGQGQAHNNMMPSLVINYCIALTGIFPPRN